ncbi:MAG: hypothetical protein MJK14_05830 [Rivularia sp. ALOHA_DT_140]|nr:hypothetical protein [Rivularia sp. ALOHA_DT_140]
MFWFPSSTWKPITEDSELASKRNAEKLDSLGTTFNIALASVAASGILPQSLRLRLFAECWRAERSNSNARPLFTDLLLILWSLGLIYTGLARMTIFLVATWRSPSFSYWIAIVDAESKFTIS